MPSLHFWRVHVSYLYDCLAEAIKCRHARDRHLDHQRLLTDNGSRRWCIGAVQHNMPSLPVPDGHVRLVVRWGDGKILVLGIELVQEVVRVRVPGGVFTSRPEGGMAGSGRGQQDRKGA